MGWKRFLSSLASVALLVATTSVNAATITLRTDATTVEQVGGLFSLIRDSDNIVVDTVTSVQNSATIQSSITTLTVGPQSGTSTSTASVDIVTGELKASASTSYTGQFGQSQTSGFGEAEVSETFTVTGSGTVMVSYSLDGSFNLSTTAFAPNPAPGIGFQAQGTLNILGPNLLDSDNIRINQSTVCTSCSSASGTIDELLTASAFVNDGDTISIEAVILAQITTGEGTVDLSQTGRLFIELTSGLSLTPSDLDYLTNPTFVPVPAALWLFGSGLLGLIGIARRKKA